MNRTFPQRKLNQMLRGQKKKWPNKCYLVQGSAVQREGSEIEQCSLCK